MRTSSEGDETLNPDKVFRESRPYGPSISDAVASGELNEMREARAFAAQWLQTADAELATVRESLAELDRAIADVEAA